MKYLFKTLLVLVTLILISSCEDPSNLSYTEYSIGDTGPAGGIIFYDCDADNGTSGSDGLVSSTTGWRYLEAAPFDMSLSGNVPTVSASNSGSTFIFGYQRDGDNPANLFVNNSATYSLYNCTSYLLGDGEQNTTLLVDLMNDSPYSDYRGTGTKSNYAAKICKDLVYGGKSDWFLPSEEELLMMHENLYENGLGDFFISDEEFYYWSSSEATSSGYTGEAISSWAVSFRDGFFTTPQRSRAHHVRSIRAF